MIYDAIIIGAGRTGMAMANQLVDAQKSVLMLDQQPACGGWNQPYWASVSPESMQIKERFSHSERDQRVSFRPNTTAVGLLPARRTEHHTILARHQTGTDEIKAKFVIVASGSFERPRESLKIPGTRPAGIFTGQSLYSFLQRGWIPGNRVALVGLEPYVLAQAKQLTRQGIPIAAQVITGTLTIKNSEREHPSTLAGTVQQILGYPRVESIQVKRTDHQEVKIACDTVVFSCGRMPNTLFLKGSGIQKDAHEEALMVDPIAQTSIPGIFALGSCVTGESFHDVTSSVQSICNQITSIQ